MNAKKPLACLLAGTIAALTAGCADDASSTQPPAASPTTEKLPTTLTGQKLDWHPCPPPATKESGQDQQPGGPWECSTLKAPLDYTKPSGQTIDIALVRTTAKEPAGRIGSLVFNFGGPGGSGVETLPGLGEAYKKLNSRYDLVSFDPRGVDRSEGVKCLSDKEIDARAAATSLPSDTENLHKAMADAKKMAEACQKNSARVLPFVDTQSTARDMDLMREVLGDKKLSYFGISYGTKLGGVYAHLFPEHVGRAVLDAVEDPTKDSREEALGQAKGFQLALNNFMRECAAIGKRCPTGEGGEEGVRRLTDFLSKLDTHPLTTGTDRPLTKQLATTGLAAALYSKEQWPVLAKALAMAMQNRNGEVLLALADEYNGRGESGHYSTQQNANTAINCVDNKPRLSVPDAQAALPAFRQASPVFGEFLGESLLSCAGWPVEGKSDRPDVSAKGSAPIVVIGNTGDPATPYEGAQNMVRSLGTDVGVNVTLKGEGHGGYNTGNPCLAKAVEDYLLDGKVPAQGTTCS